MEKQTMTDEELARELRILADQCQGLDGGAYTFENGAIKILARVRLDEAKLIRDEYLDQGGWELVNKAKFDAHIAALEQAAGGSAAGDRK